MLSIGWTAIQLLISDFFIVFQDVVFNWLTQLRWFSALYFAFEGLLTIQFKGFDYKCTGALSEDNIAFIQDFVPSISQRLNVVVSSLNQPNCILRPEATFAYFGFSRPFSTTISILIGYWLATHLATFIAILVLARRERR